MEKLLYAILTSFENPPELHGKLAAIKGIPANNLDFVSVNAISAITCSVDKDCLGTEKSDLIAYAGVIEKLSHLYTLLPMRFGSIMKSDEAIIGMLTDNYPALYENLLKVRNKKEFGLKVFCEPEAIRAFIKKQLEDSAEADNRVGEGVNRSVFREYVNMKLKEHKQEEALLNYIDTLIVELKERLELLNTEVRIKKMITGTLLVDAVFLLDSGDINALVEMVEAMKGRHPLLNFMLTGPWPPYSFVDTKIR